MSSAGKFASFRFFSMCLILLCLPLRHACADTTVVAWGGNVTTLKQATNAILVQATLYWDTVIRKDHSVVFFDYAGAQVWATNPAMSFLKGYPDSFVQIATNHTLIGHPTPPALSNVVSISGAYPSLALKSDGTVISFSPSTQAIPSVSNIVAISTCGGFNMALKNDGTVAAWGLNSTNEITNIPPGLSNVVAIASGDRFGLTLTRDGTVQCWPFGALGIYSSVTDIPTGLSHVIAIAAGEYDAMALKDDGTVAAWGYGPNGETNVPPSLTKVTQIAVGDGMFALVDDQFPPRVMVTGASLSNNIFSLSIPSLSGHVYDLEYTTNLNNWSWLPLVAGNGESLTLTDTNLTDQQRFYRVRKW